MACRYAQLAAHAQDIGRKSLAAALLEKETCASEQASGNRAMQSVLLP